MSNLAFRAANSATDQSQSTNAISVTKPTGTAQDDLLDATFVTFIASPATAPTHTLPSGWQVAATGTFTILGGAFNGRVTRAYKIAGASEGASYSFTASANCVMTVDIRAYDNPDTATPFDIASAVSQFTGASALTCPTVTTTAVNAMVTGACLSDGTSGGLVTYTSSDLTERTDSNSLFSGDVIQAAAGASGTKAITASSGGAGFTVTVAYNSETAGGGGTPAKGRLSLLGAGI